jgi:hypothetical protein
MWGWNAAVWAARTAMLAFVLYGPAMSAFFLAMKTSILTSLPAIWAFSAALFANPITWIVLGIVALIAAIVALVVYWDEVTDAVTRFSTVVFGRIGDAWAWLKQLFNDNAWLKVVFAPLYGAISVVDVLIDGFAKLPQWWSEFQIWLSGISLVPVWDLHMEAFVAIKEWWINFKAWLANLDPFAFLGESVDWMRKKLSWIPGFEMEDTPTQVVKKTEKTQQSINQMVALPGSEPLAQEDRGGLFQSISNLFGGSSKTTSVEKIEVHNHGTGVRGEDLAYELEMAAG